MASKRLLDEFDLDAYYDGKTKADVQENWQAEKPQVGDSLLGVTGTENYMDRD